MADFSDFWICFLNKAQGEISLYEGVKPTKKSWKHTKPGSIGNFTTSLNTKKSCAWVEICFQEKTPEISNGKFDHFYEQRSAVEKKYGGRLTWMRLPEIKRSRIVSEEIPFDYSNRNSWDKAIEQLLEKMARFIPAIEAAATELDSSLPKKATVIRKKKGSLPKKSDSDYAIQQLSTANTEAILDQIEKKFNADEKSLHPNWRTITKKNIQEYWYK